MRLGPKDTPDSARKDTKNELSPVRSKMSFLAEYGVPFLAEYGVSLGPYFYQKNSLSTVDI